MTPRARVPLLCVYTLLALCGLVSLFTPVESVASTVIPILVKAWGVFFLVGGITSTVALVARGKRSSLGWWYIEISGICLLASSSLLYSSVLLALSVERQSIGLFGIVCLILSLTASLVGRAVEAFHIAKLERRILDELTQRDREE